MAASMSPAVATTGFTSMPVIVRMSSRANTFEGSDMATISRPSSNPIGMARYRRATCSLTRLAAAGSMC
jgi:hypothetical protein